MEVFAGTNKLNKILNDSSLIMKHYGKSRARRIVQRLDEFNAARTLEDIPSDPPSRCHLLKGDRGGTFSVDVSANYRLVFEGYDQNDKQTTQKSNIVTVQIISIEDYH